MNAPFKQKSYLKGDNLVGPGNFIICLFFCNILVQLMLMLTLSFGYYAGKAGHEVQHAA